MKVKKTPRGFELIEFKDEYGEECSLQESSLATEACIWLGRDRNALPHPVFGSELSPRMHLTQKQVKKLLPHLQEFVKTGYLSIPKIKKDEEKE